MHILSDRHRSEFLAVPQLIRFTMAMGQQSLEPTLLVKTTTLLAKFLIRLKKFRLVFFRIEHNYLGYGVQIHDDPDHPITIWSPVESEDEMQALRTLKANPQCKVFLFNELAFSLATCDIEIDVNQLPISLLIDASSPCLSPSQAATLDFKRFINSLEADKISEADGTVLDLPNVENWELIRLTYISNGLSKSEIDIGSIDEGGQQEEIAFWLIDNLMPNGAIKNPIVLESTKDRELSDLLLSYHHGYFLFESKTLEVLGREFIPSRSKLTKNVLKSVDKALKQVKGGMRNITSGHDVLDQNGQLVKIDRSNPPHVIILVPDLSLLADATNLGGDFIRGYSHENNCILHILDLIQLFRGVQAAEMMLPRSQSATLLQLFDYWLMERFERALITISPHFEMLVRFEES